MKTKLTKLTKTIMSSLLLVCGLVSLVAAMAPVTSGTARADIRVLSCGVYTLHGSYVRAMDGFNIVGGVAQPKAIVEGMNFNGDGTVVSPFSTVSINGVILRFAGGMGSYTVAADCTGTLTFPGVSTYDIFVEPSGNQLWMIQTSGALPAVFEGTATRVSR
jgi:hypothetical protein